MFAGDELYDDDVTSGNDEGCGKWGCHDCYPGDDDYDMSLSCDDCDTYVPEGDGRYWPEFDASDELRICAECFDKREMSPMSTDSSGTASATTWKATTRSPGGNDMFSKWVAMYDSKHDSDYELYRTYDEAIQAAIDMLRTYIEMGSDEMPEDLQVLVLEIADELVPDKHEPDTWSLWDQQWDCWYTITIYKAPWLQELEHADKARSRKVTR